MFTINDADFVQRLGHQLFLGGSLHGFQVAYDGVLNDVCQGQTNQSIAGISARAIQFVRIVEGIAALGGAALFVKRD